MSVSIRKTPHIPQKEDLPRPNPMTRLSPHFAAAKLALPAAFWKQSGEMAGPAVASR
jgi:hypothetical protein